jgi:hypothetical protein
VLCCVVRREPAWWPGVQQLQLCCVPWHACTGRCFGQHMQTGWQCKNQSCSVYSRALTAAQTYKLAKGAMGCRIVQPGRQHEGQHMQTGWQCKNQSCSVYSRALTAAQTYSWQKAPWVAELSSLVGNMKVSTCRRAGNARTSHAVCTHGR